AERTPLVVAPARLHPPVASGRRALRHRPVPGRRRHGPDRFALSLRLPPPACPRYLRRGENPVRGSAGRLLEVQGSSTDVGQPIRCPPERDREPTRCVRNPAVVLTCLAAVKKLIADC